ncbi:hypothetical protein [Nisaea sp.]|uniref:hypothetical protein n=1 Tax=Nisaea sp. TaxID=2024842 RepID=UPI003296BAC3
MREIDTSGADGVDHSSLPPPPAAGAYDNGRPAASGTPAQDHGKSCGVPAGNGEDGHIGLPGTDGANGGDGGNGSDFTFSADEMKGDWQIDTSGGHGGGGQTGGMGGVGQNGGHYGESSNYCRAGDGGLGGAGGAGGAGGDGGEPGNAGNIYVTYRHGFPTFSKVSLTGGTAGAGANGGRGGEGGSSSVSNERLYTPSGESMIGPAGAQGKPATPSVGGSGVFNLNNV